ncbi:G3E family GTPase [Olsenella profusa DSM 13989]|uniref:CobW/P47K family protein n=1 Tax=Olsenella profusa F0195 TaxID=1125712 RepID=U2TJA5_9ACTN|nr:GTP-binding protein [Olsenella profusa]ERL06565.1 CobW/P47K family protein [Olsenella profusa F0195]MDP9860265.1 G3E family GTPase [Olsenella profusa DSM 13989]
MRVLVVSGFLGAGKTTFIQELVHRTGKDVVIYENEYGEADVDARRLRADSDIKVWESAENCICCSGRQDFATSVLTISNTLDPEYLIVEPTGVARLGRVMKNLVQVVWERIELLAPVTIVDAGAWEAQRRNAPEVFDDQVGSAATIVVSKLGVIGAERAAMGLAAELNPSAELVASAWSELPDEWWASLLTRGLGCSSNVDAGAGGKEDPEADELETMALEHASLPTLGHLAWVLDALSAGVFGRLDRAKGALPCGNQWLRFDLVERAWAITGADEAEEARCVFIGRDLYRSGLREVFVPALWRDDAEIHHEHHHEHEQGHDHRGHHEKER